MKKNIHVVGAVITLNGKILCAQRGFEKALPGLWEFPRGKIGQGEMQQRALQHERHCEIGERVKHTVSKLINEEWAYAFR